MKLKKLEQFGLLIVCALIFSCSTSVKNIKKTNKPERTNYNMVKISDEKTKDNVSGVLSTENKQSEKTFMNVPYVFPSFKGWLGENIETQVSSEKKNGKIKISVENMPLNKFIDFVFGETLKESYFVDNRVKNRSDLVSIRMEKPVDKKKFLSIIYDILSRYNVSISNKNGTLFIVPGRTYKQELVSKFVVGRTGYSDFSNNEYIAAIIPFYYVNPSSFTAIIKNLSLSKDAQIAVIPGTNSVIIIDEAKNIKKAIKLINLFDRITFVHKKAIIIRLDYIGVDKFTERLKSVLPLEGIPISTRLTNPGIILVPLQEINSIFIIASKDKWIDVVRFWKSKLDTVEALGNKPRFFVYYPKNRRAEDLMKVFTQVGKSVISSKKAPTQSAFLSNNAKVVVDNGRNALIIVAPPEEYKQIKNVLDKIDTLPKEVLVNVTIAEITLTKNLQYGVEWYLQHNGKYSGILTTVGGLSLGSGGLNYSLITDTQKFKAFLNMYAHKNLINVISSPRLVVLDNHEATINVGTQVPTVTSETNSSNIQTEGTTSLLRTIQYRNTGVILHIRPTINSGGILTLDISQEVSEPQVNDTSKIDSPLILDRSIQTSVVLKSGTTLLLGGLIKNNKSSTVSKVPLLGDIPLLGELFKTTSTGNTKTELIIEITPYIISNMGEARNKTVAFESLIKWFKKNKE